MCNSETSHKGGRTSANTPPASCFVHAGSAPSYLNNDGTPDSNARCSPARGGVACRVVRFPGDDKDIAEHGRRDNGCKDERCEKHVTRRTFLSWFGSPTAGVSAAAVVGIGVGTTTALWPTATVAAAAAGGIQVVKKGIEADFVSR